MSICFCTSSAVSYSESGTLSTVLSVRPVPSTVGDRSYGWSYVGGFSESGEFGLVYGAAINFSLSSAFSPINLSIVSSLSDAI